MFWAFGFRRTRGLSRGSAELESSKVSHFNHRVMVNVSES